MANDDWLLRWPEGPDGIVEVYRYHHWWDTFENEAVAREYLAEHGWEPGN
jgi:hypothetical protein